MSSSSLLSLGSPKKRETEIAGVGGFLGDRLLEDVYSEWDVHGFAQVS